MRMLEKAGEQLKALDATPEEELPLQAALALQDKAKSFARKEIVSSASAPAPKRACYTH